MSSDVRNINSLIIGKAKTGTTALATLIQTETHADTLHMEPKGILGIVNNLPDTGNFVTKLIFEHYRGRFRHLNAIIHNELYVNYDRVIFIQRDIRDEMLSRLLYLSKVLSTANHPAERWNHWIEVLQQKESDPSSLSFFDLCERFKDIFSVDAWNDITDTHTTTEREFRNFVSTALRRDHHIVSYEDMMDNRLESLSTYLGFPLTQSTSELDLGQWAYTKRSGTYGGWRAVFRPDDVARVREILDAKGVNRYEDWSLEDNPVLDPNDFSLYVRKICGAT